MLGQPSAAKDASRPEREPATLRVPCKQAWQIPAWRSDRGNLAASVGDAAVPRNSERVQYCPAGGVGIDDSPGARTSKHHMKRRRAGSMLGEPDRLDHTVLLALSDLLVHYLCTLTLCGPAGPDPAAFHGSSIPPWLASCASQASEAAPVTCAVRRTCMCTTTWRLKNEESESVHLRRAASIALRIRAMEGATQHGSTLLRRRRVRASAKTRPHA